MQPISVYGLQDLRGELFCCLLLVHKQWTIWCDMMSIYVNMPYYHIHLCGMWALDLDLILFVSPCVARVTSSVRILTCGGKTHKRKACRLTFIYMPLCLERTSWARVAMHRHSGRLFTACRCKCCQTDIQVARDGTNLTLGLEKMRKAVLCSILAAGPAWGTCTIFFERGQQSKLFFMVILRKLQ